MKHGCPGSNKVKIWQKSLSPTFWPCLPHPQGHVMSVKCEEPIDELTVQVWLLYHHLNFTYCTLFESGTIPYYKLLSSATRAFCILPWEWGPFPLQVFSQSLLYLTLGMRPFPSRGTLPEPFVSCWAGLPVSRAAAVRWQYWPRPSPVESELLSSSVPGTRCSHCKGNKTCYGQDEKTHHYA